MADRNGQIIMCKNIKLDRNYNNVLNYTEAQMLSLCRANQVASASNYSFIRERGTIKTHFPYAQCLQANYIAFQNPDYSNKWFFAWIDNVDYKSDGCGELSFTIDEWSTWFNKVTLSNCYIIREHVSDDTEGLHTIPENLDTGEYKVISHLRDSFNREKPVETNVSGYYVVVASTIDLRNDNNVFAGIYDGIPSGVKYFAFQINYSDPEFSPLQDLADVLYRLASNPLGSKLDAIQGMFIVPYWLAKDLPNESIAPKQVFTSITPLKNLDGYVPKNKKCLTYPYVYHLLSNFQGQDAILRQEFWDKLQQDTTVQDGTVLPAGDMVLQIWGAITQGCSIRAVPENYNGDEIATNVGINLGKFPQVCWNTDAFINWLTENGVNIAMATAGAIAGAGTGNVAMTTTSLLKGADLLKSGIEASQTPPQSHGNTNNGDIMLAMDENCFHVLKMSIRSDYAKRIDDYFTRYGYRVNELKTPNISSRTYFNFLQIAEDSDIGYGEIPSKSMEVINGACRSGVTIWHNHANIGNYSLNNSIVQ